ncbi:hypothetical protein MKR28_00005 [Staphylococcus haemolyticus]|uniref:hypothetical protein n=1 Tax=Staphylococcus haemolyticus TaxID=1283 RepID=UPI001F0B17D5|nr:hypothetical protein [Staphylococcus haemolyticus]MCH4458808.1 hypothetical protein [Staphylococcus haemolyticus]
MTRSKVSFLAPVVADLRSARVGRCQANRMDAMSRYRDRKVSFFMHKNKTEGLIRYQQMKV